MKDITLKEIAAELELITTASKALKNYPDVSEKPWLLNWLQKNYITPPPIVLL
jgi:hypothetical protein